MNIPLNEINICLIIIIIQQNPINGIIYENKNVIHSQPQT